MSIYTGENLWKMNKIFVDTSFAIAFVSKRDKFYESANNWADRIESAKIPIITTQAVLLEIGNALAKPKHRLFAVNLLRNFENDQKTQIISLTDELYDRAFELFSKRPDKEWGLVDCVSFVVMDEQGITEALTADEHFVQAGFRALLREQEEE